MANLEVITLEECDSTNAYLKRNYEHLKDKFPVLVTSRLQTAGKGRGQRTWLSARGKGLYSSFGFNLRARQYLNLLPLVTGICVFETVLKIIDVSKVPNGQWGIKWPNDVICEGKKIAGILIETVVTDSSLFCIVGIGLNLNHTKSDFPGELVEKATSLKMLINAEHNFTVEEINPILSYSFLQWLEKLEHGNKEEIIETFSGYSRFLLNKPICFHYLPNKVISGIFKGINHEGGLLLESENGNLTVFYSGEIS